MGPQGAIRRYLYDGIVIVASILIAFSIDAWWAERTEKLGQHDLLVALQGEFAATQSEIERAGTVHRARLSATDELIRIMDGNLPRPLPEGIWTLITAAHKRTTIDPPGGVLDSALGAGSLAHVQDSELRAALAGWPRKVLDFERTEANIRDYLNNSLMPWFAENAFYPKDNDLNETWSADVDRLLVSAVYRGHIWNVRHNTRFAVEENDLLLLEAARIRKLLADAIR